MANRDPGNVDQLKIILPPISLSSPERAGKRCLSLQSCLPFPEDSKTLIKKENGGLCHSSLHSPPLLVCLPLFRGWTVSTMIARNPNNNGGSFVEPLSHWYIIILLQSLCRPDYLVCLGKTASIANVYCELLCFLRGSWLDRGMAWLLL